MKTAIARKVDTNHAILQAFHWAGSASLWGYMTVLLLSLGFTNSHIGTLNALSLLACILIQPALASWIDRRPNLSSRRVAMVLTVISLVAAVGLWLFLRISVVVTVCAALLGIIIHIIPPFVNSIIMEYSQRGVPVNYGLGRGIGSVSYAVVCLGMGIIVENFSVIWIIPAFLAAFLGQFISFYTFRYPLPNPAGSSAQGEDEVLNLGRFLRKYPAFTVLIVGCAFLQGSQNTLNTYMIHVAERVGAGEELMGRLLAIAACMELPSMALFNRIRRRIPLKWLLRICGFGFLAKCALFSLAQTTALLYIASALQFMQLGLFVPCTVCYVAEKLDRANQAKGQGLIHVCSNGLGPAFTAFVCGRLMDAMGIGSTLTFLCISALFGCVIVWLATSRLLDKEAIS